VVRSNNTFRIATVFTAIATFFWAVGAFAASSDFYTTYQKARVIAHLPLSGSAPAQMFLQQQGRKQYLFVQQNGQKGFTVVDVSKPKRPEVVTNVPQQSIAAMGSGLAISEKAQANSDHASATPQSVKVLDVSNPAHPRTVQTFNDVTSIATDNSRGLVYVANNDGIWVLSHQRYLRRHECSSSDAISSAEPNCD
jgi:hypothetical protein